MSKRADLTNKQFGKLTALFYSWSDKRGHAIWMCACECGRAAFVKSNSLLTENTTSCDCTKRELLRQKNKARATHGCKRNGRIVPEYTAFVAAKGRCTNPNNRSWKDYGGRGIKFLYKSFDEFLADVGSRPGPEYSLDRINVNGNYEPGNCRWSDKQTQADNRRVPNESLRARITELEAENKDLRQKLALALFYPQQAV